MFNKQILLESKETLLVNLEMGFIGRCVSKWQVAIVKRNRRSVSRSFRTILNICFFIRVRARVRVPVLFFFCYLISCRTLYNFFFEFDFHVTISELSHFKIFFLYFCWVVQHSGSIRLMPRFGYFAIFHQCMHTKTYVHHNCGWCS